MRPVASNRKVDETTIVRFYREAERENKPKLPFTLGQFTLTTTPLGLGDTVVLTDLPYSAARAGRAVTVHSPSPFFSTLMSFNPHYQEGRCPFWVAADSLRLRFDLGNGHFIQRIQRAFGFPAAHRPQGHLEVPGRCRQDSRVIMHFEPGGHVEWQRQHIHPAARAIYPETRTALQQFVNRHPELDFFEVGTRSSGLDGVEDRTGAPLAATIELIASCGYFVGIISGPMHLAAALDLKVIGIINFPEPNRIYLPVLKDIPLVESSWLYPQSVLLHQEGEGELVARCSLDNLERAFGGDIYPYWTDRYLPLIDGSL
jgi:hypothetical protein